MRASLGALGMALLLPAACDSPVEGSRPDAYPTPVLVSESLAFSQIGASGEHTCAVGTDEQTYCWGRNEYGALGTFATMEVCDEGILGAFPCSGIPLPVSGAARFVSLAGSAGNGHTCGLTPDRTAYCWGFGLDGQLGDGARSNRVAPGPVSYFLRYELLRVGLGGDLTCGIAQDGHTYCWGSNSSGQLGNGSAAGVEPEPVRVTGALRFRTFDLGGAHACGLVASGEAYCWGSNREGQLGVGSAGAEGGTAGSESPLPVVTDVRFEAIATGGAHSCGLSEGGAAYCWGSAEQVGSAASVERVTTPRAVAGGRTFVSLHAGAGHTCGLAASGEAYCWGANGEGELGDGTLTDRPAPSPLALDVALSRLSHRPHCGLAEDGRAYCWGANRYGQVGRPSPIARR